MSSDKKTRPPPLIPTTTFTYKSVPSLVQNGTNVATQPVPIKADIFLPAKLSAGFNKLLLFIHGGGWIHSNRTDYGPPLFRRLLSSGFVICSMDYRLCPETLFSGMCEDLQDIEGWLKNSLQTALQNNGYEMNIDAEYVVVVGASAGAHLALMTPTLWSTPPKAIISLYGPTDFHNIPYLNLGPRRPELWPIPDISTDLLIQASNFSTPPTEFPMPTRMEDFKSSRYQMGQQIYRGELLGDFLVKGLIRYIETVGGQPHERLRLPTKGEAKPEEIDDISEAAFSFRVQKRGAHLTTSGPLHLCIKCPYPPVYQLMGTADHLFKIDHMMEFEKAMKGRGQECVSVVVEDGAHGFDIYADDKLDQEILGPAVEWLVGKATRI